MDYSYKHFRVEFCEDKIAVVKIDAPKSKNALFSGDWTDFLDLLHKLEDDKRARVIILTSAVPGTFIAGADIKEFMNASFEDALFSESAEVTRTIARCRKPVIAAVDGMAFGGGFEVALASDFRIITDRTVFGLPETGLGVIPGMGGTQRLAKMLGTARAKEIIMLGRNIKAEAAVEYGLALKSVPEGALMDEAVQIARRLMKKGPRALAISKRCIEAAYATDLDTGMLLENISFCALMSGKEMKEGTAAFLQSRAPEFETLGW